MSALAHHNALPSGARIESFEIANVLGVGGFGITYKGYDHSLHCDVAIKEYLPHGLALRTHDGTTVIAKSDNDKKYYEFGLQRFLEEARILAKFKERSIVRVSRFLEANGTGYLVMDYEDGESLSEMLRRVGRLEEAEIRAIALPILHGLRAVHAKDFLHRDIKPGNIFLRRDGSPVLLDFGAARQALTEHTRTLTGIVTPGYGPLEQYGVRGKQGPWTDLYALGATLYHCIAGKAPPEAPDRVAARQEGEADPLKPAVEVGAGRYSRELLETIDWMLAPNAKDRPQTADAVLARLQTRHTVTTKRTRPTVTMEKTILLRPGPAAAEEAAPSAPPTRDQIEAFKACQRRAENGEAAAQYELGMMYAYGRGTARDATAARQWLGKAADAGHSAAQSRLGLMLARGGVARDKAAAADWLRRAAEQNDAVAQFNLAMMYAHGLGVTQDMTQARHWYRRAAELGHAGARSNLQVLEARPVRWWRWLGMALGAIAAVVVVLVARRLLRG
jgi:serine/threonine protein kinase